MNKKYRKEDIKVVKADPKLWDSVDISENGFAKSLSEAACVARDFTKKFVTNRLPDDMKYVVCLGCSYDGNPLGEDEYTFTEDYKNPKRTFNTQEDVVNLLWRDGMVPEWIDVQVVEVDEEHTYIQLTCCGRFSSNKRNMYHPHEGRAPFHAVGSILPTDYALGHNTDKFDLHWNKNANNTP